MFEAITEEAYRRLLPNVSGRAFLFFGKEDYLKSVALKATRTHLCPDEAMAFFNDVTIEFTDYTPDKLLDAMAAPPMMTGAKLIVLRGFDFTSVRQGELDALLACCEQLAEYDYNTIILHVAEGQIEEGRAPLKRPTAQMKKLQEHITPVYFDSPTDGKLLRWMEKHFAHYGVTCPTDCATAILDLVGKSMFVLSNEMEKVAAFVKEQGRTSVSMADVKNVVASVFIPDTFALSNALLAGKGQEALEALATLKFQRIEPTVILGEIASVFLSLLSVRTLLDDGHNIAEISKELGLHEYRAGLYARAVSDVSVSRLSHLLSLVAEADMALKSSYVGYAPLEKLITAL